MTGSVSLPRSAPGTTAAVILATGYAELPGDEPVLRLAKPFTQSELESAVNGALEGKATASRAAAAMAAAGV